MSTQPSKAERPARIRPIETWPRDNEYAAEGRCPNCGDKVDLLVRKGIKLSEVEMSCECCEADNYEVSR